MTKIDFYITEAKTPDELYQFAARLTEKAYKQKHQIYLHTEDESAMQSVDELLWTFRPNSFLPHRCENDARLKSESSDTDPQTIAQEILVACSGDPGEHHDVLVNLTEQTPAFFSRFTRVAEVVSSDERARSKSRERYKYYRDRGYPLKVHNL